MRACAVFISRYCMRACVAKDDHQLRDIDEKLVLSLEDTVDKIRKQHSLLGHPGIQKTHFAVCTTVSSCPQSLVKLALQGCASCSVKGPYFNREELKPILSERFLQRCVTPTHTYCTQAYTGTKQHYTTPHTHTHKATLYNTHNTIHTHAQSNII